MNSKQSHFKMYKVGRNWLFASASVLAMSQFLMVGTAKADTADTDTTPTTAAVASTTQTTSNQVALTSSSSTASNTGNQTTTDAAETTPATTSSTASTNASVTDDTTSTTNNTDTNTGNTTTDSATTQASSATVPAGTKTTTASDGATTYDLPAGATNDDVASTKQAVAATGATKATVTAKSAVVAAADTTAASTATTVDQLNGKFIADDGSVADKNSSIAIGSSTEGMTNEITDNFTGQTDKPTVNPTFGEVYTDPTTGKTWVRLVDHVTGSATSYSYNNQIDTTKAFSISGEWYFSTNNPGGGIGIILQPVNPSVAGLGAGSKASDDLGIYGQPSTTFIGIDGYQTTAAPYFDTPTNAVTIRQTDSNDGKTFVNMNLDKTNSSSGATNVIYNSSSSLTSPNIKLPITTSLIDVLYKISWTPTNTATEGTVLGTMSVSTYKATDTAMTTPTTLTVTDLALNSAESIALFGAMGGGGATLLTQGSINTFSLTQATQTVTVNYLDEQGNTLAPSTTMNANVGNSVSVANAAIDGSNTYAAPTIDGYAFAGSAGTDLNGIFQANTVNVLDESMLGSSATGAYNTINVYYKKSCNHNATTCGRKLHNARWHGCT
ncbi:MucBP domain-containing protein [Secundilactobacillus odoratitofui]|uniref:MucBP domain-containing protein n=1 Tax=Secundilactobacillus odoratitofui TaxID=480930 RepID=UPI000A8EFFE2|nr:MucBP domain-containing protein [Secundilactobacillus odoratitofui]